MVRPLVLLLASTVAWMPVASSGSSETDVRHEQHHTGEPAETPAPEVAPKLPQQIQQDTELDAKISHLHAINERLSRATTPEEVQALMVERNEAMHDAMALMHKNMLGMAGIGRTPAARGEGGATSVQLQMCQEMMGHHMDAMQEMMQMIMKPQGMGDAAMGPGMGSGATGK